MTTISISLLKATGLPKQAISPFLKLAESSSVLLIIKTWLLSPNKYPTFWQQFYAYGQPIQSIKNRGSLGIALLVNPSYLFSVQYIPLRHSLLTKYTLSFVISKHLFHCLYLLPSLSHTEILQHPRFTTLGYNQYYIHNYLRRPQCKTRTYHWRYYSYSPRTNII